MSKEQPEALPVRLAKRLCDGISTGHDWPNTDDELLRMQSASELRRLHAENEALRAQIGQGEPEEGDLLTIAYLHGFAKGKEAAHNIGEKK